MNIEMLLKQVSDQRKAEATNMRLGQFIDALSERHADQEVSFDFCGTKIGAIGSYRGFYEDLALSPSSEYEGSFKTVGDLLARLKSAIGETFEGYKGGDFVMTEETIMWAASYGDSGSTMIVGVNGDNCETIIETRWTSL